MSLEQAASCAPPIASHWHGQQMARRFSLDTQTMLSGCGKLLGLNILNDHLLTLVKFLGIVAVVNKVKK